MSIGPKARASITGWAWRTPLGASIDEVVSRMLAGERAATPDHRFPLATYPCSLVAPIAGEPRSARHRRFLRRINQFAIEAGLEAFERAGHGRDALAGRPAAEPSGSARQGDRLGLFTAVGGLRADWDELMPALASQAPNGDDAWERGFRLLHPFWMLRYLSNNVHALLAADIAARGEGVCFGGPNAGAQALVAASRALQAGAIDVALVVAYDSLIEPETLVELGARGAVARADRAHLAPPYSDRASGFVPGEAAAAVVLERPEEASGRALAIVTAVDASDGRKGEPLAETIQRAAAAVADGDGIVDGAARALPDLDITEREALARALDPAAVLLATAASMGHVGAAASLVQVIALGNFIARRVLPPIAGLSGDNNAGNPRDSNTNTSEMTTRNSASPGPLRPLGESIKTRARSAVGVSTGAPGSVGAVRVEVP
jgi:3-oxoacyl-(acyl-carrier-protein) synthase